MISLLIGVGLIGLSGLSWLCPLLAFPVYYSQRRTLRSKSSTTSAGRALCRSIDILIPAHNEAEHISSTLKSIQRSIDCFRSIASGAAPIDIGIQVGADRCTDLTAQIAGQFQGVLVKEFPENGSKWKTLNALIAGTSADWVILVDSGTVWPENFLTDFAQKVLAEPDALAIAPSYKPLKAGLLSKILWRLETLLKRMESYSGGPVSLHGATIGYPTTLLKHALKNLGNTQWLNDDVVIPLELRARYPERVIHYPVGQVRDEGVKQDRMDLGRRKRMVLGNLQWVTALLPDCLRRNPVAGMVAMRRVFRVLWAYWLACIGIGLAFEFHSVLLPAIIGAAILAALSGSFRQLAGAGLSSLLAPFRITRPNWQWEGNWE